MAEDADEFDGASAGDGETGDGSDGLDLDVVDLDHVALRVSDLDRALSFYRDLLGLPVRDRERYEAGEVPYVAVVAGGRHLHLVPTDEPFDVDGEHVCLLLRGSAVDTEDEVRALLDDLRERGVEVEDGEPYKRYGAYGRAWAAYVRDPDGRRVELKLH
ncbi:VOC family protein [Halobium salinum]|uniref:VOC family protein n=1 Tax=Halobium salinum TaxID=1364940 RepID=A0ABD5PEV1_9EURY|nr:VOC family protein [Halobium salinum]